MISCCWLALGLGDWGLGGGWGLGVGPLGVLVVGLEDGHHPAAKLASAGRAIKGHRDVQREGDPWGWGLGGGRSRGGLCRLVHKATVAARAARTKAARDALVCLLGAVRGCQGQGKQTFKEFEGRPRKEENPDAPTGRGPARTWPATGHGRRPAMSTNTTHHGYIGKIDVQR